MDSIELTFVQWLQFLQQQRKIESFLSKRMNQMFSEFEDQIKREHYYHFN